MQAAEAELAEGQRIWSEACSGACQDSFCAGARERQYITALGAVYFVACALQGGCTIGGVDDAAIMGSLTRCQECWRGQTPGECLLCFEAEACRSLALPFVQLYRGALWHGFAKPPTWPLYRESTPLKQEYKPPARCVNLLAHRNNHAEACAADSAFLPVPAAMKLAKATFFVVLSDMFSDLCVHRHAGPENSL